MKKIGFLTIALIGAIIFFSLESCNTDDEGPSNYFTHGENTYSLKSGIIGYDSSPSSEGIYRHFAMVLSPEYQIFSDSVITGTGNGLLFTKVSHKNK